MKSLADYLAKFVEESVDKLELESDLLRDDVNYIGKARLLKRYKSAKQAVMELDNEVQRQTKQSS